MTSQQQRVFDRLEDGSGPKEIVQETGLTNFQVRMIQKLWRQKRGRPEVHSKDKAQMIHRMIADRWGKIRWQDELETYEVCGMKGDNSTGICTQAYRQYGKVNSCSKKDGDWVVRTMIGVLGAEVGKKRYDIVDCDGYSDPAELLLIGLARMVKHGGLLVLTWPNKQNTYGSIHTKAKNMVVYGKLAPDNSSLATYVNNVCYQHKIRANLRSCEQCGNVWRACFHILHWKNWSKEKLMETKRLIVTQKRDRRRLLG